MFISLNEIYADFKTNWKMPTFIRKKSKITNSFTRKGKFHGCYFDAFFLIRFNRQVDFLRFFIGL